MPGLKGAYEKKQLNYKDKVNMDHNFRIQGLWETLYNHPKQKKLLSLISDKSLEPNPSLNPRLSSDLLYSLKVLNLAPHTHYTHTQRWLIVPAAKQKGLFGERPAPARIHWEREKSLTEAIYVPSQRERYSPAPLHSASL